MMLSSGQAYNLSASSGEQRNHPSSTMNAEERPIKMKAAKILLQLRYFWK